MKRWGVLLRMFVWSVPLSLISIVGPGLPCAQSAALPELRVALLPIIDAFPVHVALDRGYFKELGVDVVPVRAASALSRDQMMQSDRIDGMLNELTSTASFNRDISRIQVVCSVRQACKESPLFRVLASPQSGLSTPASLDGIPIAVSKNTIIEYVTERILEKSGLTSDRIVTTSVPVIPERFQLLMKGHIQAATLPDPLAASAIAGGARLIIDDGIYPRFSVSVFSFSTRSLQEKPQAVRLFLRGWHRAVEAIADDPEAFHELMLRTVQVPENVRRTFAIPSYPRHQVPDEAQWNDVMAWMISKGLLESALPYTSSVTRAFLP